MPLKLTQPKRKNAISLTPLIDVVFILLLFFMLTSSFVPWRIVDTPLSVASDAPKSESESENLILTLKLNDNQVWLTDRAVSLSDRAAFQSLVEENNDGVFIIKAEDGVTLQSLMKLADRLKENGANTVSIANAFAMPETPSE
ncbi:ExbD/TolR family protein [Marinomonas posidonica]|uniref:Biopolymer transport protein ExbD/TolR n=1 Tax=Marinomonas posidonica (strain CECT 7376 / NCIMB 14433 / IVIA-Po-181) TaxID=491952 RepID=F6CSQ5_MARPP|nr:biopolymer transporter ExbD [Marinomonas posidonica]AEF56213.1 Biopolymer transport protein ExbD/TolR [Marinomonas posidonica IVIA-Po-181]